MVRLWHLRDWRERKAWTQGQLAERAGVSRITVSRLECGRGNPQPPTTARLAEALGVEPYELMAPQEARDGSE